jgi:outer membrane receptor protein involved in Fe transport
MNQPTPTPKNTSRTGFARACFFLVLPALGGVSFAQTAAPAQASTSGEVVTLSPFTVSTDRDYGYRAANSISATRTNTPIKDVPVSIQVFSQELYDDLMINSQVDLERYNASLINGSSDTYSDNSIQQAFNAFLFRGFTQNWGLRDGAREYDPVDTQGLARVEIIKGPVAALYGVSYPGGVINSVNKAVDYSHNFSAVRLTARSEGGYRAAIDTNVSGKMGSGVAGLRFNVADEVTKDERAHSTGSIKFYQMVGDWQPLQGTEISLTLENSYRGKPNGLNSYAFQRGTTTGDQASIPLQILHPEIPWTWNWSNGANLRSLDVKYYRFDVTQKITDSLSLTAYVRYNSHDQIDGNGWDQAGSSGADSWEVAGRGWYTDATGDHIESGYSYRDWTNKVHAYGATGVYKYDFTGMKNTFTFGGAAYQERFVSHRSISSATFAQSFAVNSSTAVPYGPPADFHTDPVGGYNHQNNTNDYYFAALQSSFLDDKLKTNLAINRTHVKNIAWASGVDNAPVSYDITQNSPMEGLVYAITKDINFFAVHSTSLFPTSVTNSFGAPLPAVAGKSIEGGLKFETQDGKFSGTVSYYEIKQTGGAQTDPTAINNNTVAYDALTALGTPAAIAQRNATWPNRPLGDNVPGGESKSTGFEADLNYQPTHNWAIQLSYANNSNEVVTAINTATVGEANTGTIKQQISLLTKYTFTEGVVKGLSIGTGIASAGEALQGYTTDNATGNLIARYNPTTLYVDAFVTYHFKLFGLKQSLQLNAKNLTQQGEFTGWRPTGSNKLATERYTVPVSARFSLSYGIDL